MRVIKQTAILNSDNSDKELVKDTDILSITSSSEMTRDSDDLNTKKLDEKSDEETNEESDEEWNEKWNKESYDKTDRAG